REPLPPEQLLEFRGRRTQPPGGRGHADLAFLAAYPIVPYVVDHGSQLDLEAGPAIPPSQHPVVVLEQLDLDVGSQVLHLLGGESLFPAQTPQDRREGLEALVIELL